MNNSDALQVGLLAIAMQRFYNRVMAWMAAQGKAGAIGGNRVAVPRLGSIHDGEGSVHERG